MKRNLLKLVGVGEFSDTAEFKDPCLSYVLPEVKVISRISSEKRLRFVQVMKFKRTVCVNRK